MRTPRLILVFLFFLQSGLAAELKLPAIIGSHMVLQQKQVNPVWGWDVPGTEISVTFADQRHAAVAGSDGRWTVKLAPLAANATPQILTIKGSSELRIEDVLVGEVWMCSGQSNMQWSLDKAYNGDVEGAATNQPGLRLITVPHTGTQELLTDFKGHWEAASPETVKSFSAIGLLYGRYLHEILGVPVGLINNAWNASVAEAWIPRTALEQDARFKRLMAAAGTRETELLSERSQADSRAAMAQWLVDSKKAKAERRPLPARPPQWLVGNARPGNIFAGVVHPTVGYGIKGVIWYQGESNAERAREYAELFPFLIEQWRKEWGQGDFSFYWVQLANFKAGQVQPGESDWAELREAQTKALKLPNTGQAVTIDIGEGRDIHPRNKYDVATRLLRWALVKDYGMTFPYRSPEFKSFAPAGRKVVLTFDCFGSALRAFGVDEPVGFAICGEDKNWHWAAAKITGDNQVEVWSEVVATPVAVRYAWADNPACNLFSKEGLPVTPFRTDGFEMITKPVSAVTTPPGG